MVLNEEQWIKELREKRIAYGISQGRLAVASGITREYLNKIESGKMKPSKELLETLHNHFSRRNGKGVRLMKPSDFQKTVQCRFESCLKKVVRHVVKDYQKKLKRRQKEETLFCELPEIVVENLAVWDDYDTDYTIFNVCGNDIRVYDDELAEALKQLSERNRETLLMYYFLEMNNEEIAKKQNISRSGVFQNRHNSLVLMKKLLKEKQ